MSKPKARISFTVDGKKCSAAPGQTILQAAKDNGIYIPALCRWEGFKPAGACRVCTVRVGGRYMAACTQPVTDGMAVENDVPDLQDMRKALIEMLFVEGNHMCPTCEKSGNCELQALAYRFLMLVPRFPFQFPARRVEPAGKKILLEHNRCIKCLRCVRGVRTRDNKAVFGTLRRSRDKKISVDQVLASALTDKQARQAMDRCPVGSILKKEVGFAVPIGRRKYDKEPIGSDVEKARG
ncbi:MAG: 2Fe-2S iron-sulfur cluster-binding protein [Acidobacteriota bacterium]|jgi:[NiFe] hydrogenase diaphorase moiety small subunit|nr:(2Fe-2S)-binding protein [Acidobacteriota bacterium]OQB57765.1 MAG: NAD-reducing hydrogenase HoxS subunit gamma [Candidatus Aminicenantes bacterium ADurb.Bin147]HNQ80632.1 2Fe-2S iron-sulfur cluster-binding protein [Candidatus Aminicenantes bacterium]MDD8010370.1 2Fe-2S iron-sulfur cluster-binding protein [Acidobacteriota bacterium]MDD8029302.1 2Fe-2S iron-sulfur cluster-binding protein [Acidobacteriota bacterium]